MAKIGFISLGCAKNQVDCERMMYRVQEAGHSVEYELPGCDVVVINTCGFIDSAKSEAIDAILTVAQLKEQGLVGKILVTGCLSQRYQDEVRKEMPEVDGMLRSILALSQLLILLAEPTISFFIRVSSMLKTWLLAPIIASISLMWSAFFM